MSQNAPTDNNIWGPGRIVVIPTNGDTNTEGIAVMGAGLAKQAKIRYPDMPRQLGNALQQYGNRVFYFAKFGVYTFPTKHGAWDDTADLELIKKSAHELLFHAKANLPPGAVIWVPMVGCGPRTGRLDWHIQVKPMLLQVWAGEMDRFKLVEF